MKRDFDLIRNMLLKIEELTPNKEVTNHDFENLSTDQLEIQYHLGLISDNDFIIYTKLPTMGSPIDIFIIERLTSKGHDYLDSVRNPKIYEETKNKIGSFVKSCSLAIFQSTAEAIIKSHLGI